MDGSTRSFFGTGMRRGYLSLSSHVVGFSLLYLIWGLLSNAGVYGNVEYGFSLLATLGAAGCLGHLAAYAYRSSDYLTSVFSVFDGVRLPEIRHSGGVLVRNADWPLLVALLFGPFSMLLAGLGGWV